MNLKESFRYQNFLDAMMQEAKGSLMDRTHALTVTKTHLKNKSNVEAKDVTEVVEVDDFAPNDDVIAFMCWLVAEKQKLTEAIATAKASLDFCLDAAVEANKFRQGANNAIRNMLKCKPFKKTEQGRDYKFNNEGNQTAYYYEIEISCEENFNRNNAKNTMRDMIAAADKTSADIDAAMINTTVNYTPLFDVNDTFTDVMAEFITNNTAPTAF